MGNSAELVLGGINFPDFFHAEAVFLHVAVGGKVKLFDDLLGERATHAFGEEHVFAVQFHARLIVWPLGAVSVLAEFACDDAFNFAVIAKHQL